jgi:DNA polymerase III delta subunit
MLLCYHGTDAFRLRQAVTDLIGSLRSHHGASLHVARIDCSDDGAADELERHLKYPSFFGDRKLIIAFNAAGPVMADILGRYALSALDDIVLVALQDTAQKSTDKKVLATLMITAETTVALNELKGAEFDAWMRDYCEQRHTSLEPAAARELIRRVGTDTGRCASEIEKLSAYANGDPISHDMVLLLTPARPERDEWELSNAMASHDKRAMMTALWRRVQEGTPDQLLIGSLASGLRNLLMIKDLTAQKKPAAGIAKLTGLHPFVISKSLRGAGSADTGRLRSAHCAVALLDRDAKDGRRDAVDGMFSLLLSL